MGIIIKQSIKGSIWSYLGVVIGFVTTAYFYPNYLSTDTVGLLGLILSYSILFAQFSALGFHGVTSRLFPYFRNKKNNHSGFVFIAFSVMSIGFGLFLIMFILLKPWLIESNIEKSQLFTDYIDLLIPLTFFTLLFIQLDVFNKVLYNIVLGTFLQEFLQRFLIFIVMLLFAFGVITLHQLVLAYSASVCIKGIVIFVYLLIKGELKTKPQLQFIDRRLRKEIVNVALFSILTGLGGSIVFNIDKIIVNQMLGLSLTGIYTIGFFFGTLVIIPSRSLLRISGTLIADAFKRNDIAYIADIYERSCLNQFIMGAFLFGGIWINIDNILIILGPDYADAKWVILFIGMAYLFDMLTGANGQIIGYSKYYKVALYFVLILIIFVVISMYFFIPIWGIIGAAIAIAFSIIANNIMRFVFLKIKFKMQPLSSKFLIIVLILIFSYFVSLQIPKFNLIMDIIIRSSIYSLIFIVIIYFSKVSGDINTTTKKILNNFNFF